MMNDLIYTVYLNYYSTHFNSDTFAFPNKNQPNFDQMVNKIL